MAMSRRLNNLLSRPSSAIILCGGSIQRRSNNNFRLFSNMTFLRRNRNRSPFIVPTPLFYFHSNRLALAYSPEQHSSEYNFSTDSNNNGTIPHEERWEIRFNELKEYKEERGDTLVPQSYSINPQLGKWVRTQRDQYKREKISDERIRRLNEIGFVWDANEAAWQEMCVELKKYKEKYGDTLVTQYYEDNLKLGRWVIDQRQHYKYKQSGKDFRLTDERVASLNEIDFVWDPFEEFWDEMFQELKEYKEKYGDTLVPRSYDENPQLGRWVSRQRTKYKSKQLSVERKCRLNEVGFVWDPYEAAWEEMYVELKKYKEKYGNTLVPYRYSKNPQLGNWVSEQRVRYKSKKLPDERVHRLNEIGFVWDTYEVAWEEMFVELNKYKEKYGDTLVPQRYAINPQLATWVNKQRTQYKRNKISDERIHRLNELGFVWNPNDTAWEEMFQELNKYKEKYGDTLVPSTYEDNPKLGWWVMHQRKHYKLKLTGKDFRLTDERVARLTEVDFVWDTNEAAWEEMFQQLEEYKEKHGDTLVPKNYEDNPKLGIWVSNQRRHYKYKLSGKVLWLSDERAARLNRVGFVWDAIEAAWQTSYSKLCGFRGEHGHTKIPCQNGEHKGLYSWCMGQRNSEAKGKLNDDRRNLLQMINFDFFKRKVTKGSSLLENMIIYELEEIGHVFDMANAVFLERRYRPDGVIFVDDSSVIFVEVDEKFHNHCTSYPVKRELSRMIALKTEAERNGYKHATFVRIGTGEQREPNYNQLTFVSNHLHELKRTAPWKTSRVHYIDYPSDHHHIIASKAEEGFVDEVIEFSSGIW